MLPANRPVYLNLFRLHLPITGWVSILHRVSGALLFFMLPALVWGFALALSSEAGFARVTTYLTMPFAKLLMLVLVGGLAHHFFAGLRHLAMDGHWGVSLSSARWTSLVVFLATGIWVLLAAWVLFR